MSFGINVKSYMCSSDIRCSLAGATPFLLATWANDLDVMRELVAHGADPSLTTTDGTTPLMVPRVRDTRLESRGLRRAVGSPPSSYA